MKQFIGAGLLIVVAAGSAAAQDSKLYSTPTLPSREVLDRLNMRMAWRANVPMDGRRDGFLNIQIDSGQVIASTRSGTVAGYDAETGRQLWQIVVGKPGASSYSPTFNSKSVLIVSGVRLYAIDRFKGSLQWQYELPFGISASPVADERQIYLSGVNSQVAAYELPSPGAIGAATAKAPGMDTSADDPNDPQYQGERLNVALKEVRPELNWRIATDLRLDFTPASTRDSLFYATPNGYLVVFGKFPLTDQANEVYRVQLDRRLTVPPETYDEMAYVPASDTNLYAVGIPSGKTRWRYGASGDITRRPFATENDVYVTVDRKGLVRLDRATGVAKWKLPMGRTTTDGVAEADRVMAVNDKFVYAADRAGRMLVLDRATGKQLSHYEPFRDFAYPVANYATDRLILAANNGLIVCLHDREYEKPLFHRKFDFDTRPNENRLKALKERLARKVTEKSIDALAVVEVLESFHRRYGLDIFYSDKPFIDAGVNPIKDRLVLQPNVVSMEVGDYLKAVLAQADATYDVVGDRIVILPSKSVASKPMGPTPPANPDLDKIQKALSTKIDAPAREKFEIEELLLQWAARFDLEFAIDEAGFKAVDRDPNSLGKTEITFPKGNGVPFEKVLKQILNQAKADYEVRDKKVFIVPMK